MERVKIGDIQPEMHNFEVIGRIVEKWDSRRVQTRFGPSQVTTAILEDETGSISLNLWRDQIDAVNTGDIVLIANAFTRLYGENVELNIGRDGSIFVLKWGIPPSR